MILWLATRKVDHGIGDDLSILHVFAFNGRQNAVGGWERCDDRERLASIDSELGGFAVVVWMAVGIGIESTAPFVADAFEAAFVSLAVVESGDVTWVRDECACATVGLPDVELVAAGTFAFDVALIECLLGPYFKR